eukprot:7391928-Prymnesium_polylepis.3
MDQSSSLGMPLQEYSSNESCMNLTATRGSLAVLSSCARLHSCPRFPPASTNRRSFESSKKRVMVLRMWRLMSPKFPVTIASRSRSSSVLAPFELLFIRLMIAAVETAPP